MVRRTCEVSFAPVGKLRRNYLAESTEISVIFLAIIGEKGRRIVFLLVCLAYVLSFLFLLFSRSRFPNPYAFVCYRMEWTVQIFRRSSARFCSNRSLSATSYRRLRPVGCRVGSGIRVRIWKTCAPHFWRVLCICIRRSRIPTSCCSSLRYLVIRWILSLPPMFYGKPIYYFFNSHRSFLRMEFQEADFIRKNMRRLA